MNSNFNEDINDIKNRFNHKVNEVRYSSEYLDLKKDLSAAGDKMKHVVITDLKSASSNIGKIFKKIAKNERFRQLIRS